MGTCSVDFCENKNTHLGFCSKHYHKNKRYGSPLISKRAERGAPLRLLQSLLREESENCILWPIDSFKDAYPSVVYQGKHRGAHRVALLLNTNIDPPDLFACHTCDVKRCVNPKHLYWGTPAQNCKDQIDRTAPRGESHSHSVLTEEIVREIVRFLNRGLGSTEIARILNVKRTQVSDIKTGRVWSWFTGIPKHERKRYNNGNT